MISQMNSDSFDKILKDYIHSDDDLLEEYTEEEKENDKWNSFNTIIVYKIKYLLKKSVIKNCIIN